MKLIYLAGPIDQANRIDLAENRNRARKLLEMAGFTIYDPSVACLAGAAAGLADRPDPRPFLIHQEALRQSDGVLALLPWGVPTIGTPMEIGKATAMGKPVAVLGGQDSWHLVGEEGIKVFDPETPEEAVAWLCEVVESEGLDTRIPLKFTGDRRLAPIQTHPGDAGFDVYIARSLRLLPGETQDVECGISVELPPGFWGLLVGRSSAAKRGIRVQTAIIDGGYRGPLFTIVQNAADLAEDVELKAGERLAQLIPIPLATDSMRPVYVENLGESDRGDKGFGSTGA